MTGIYRSGKAATQKLPVDTLTKANFVRRFADNLRCESVYCGRKLNALMLTGNVPETLMQPVEDFYLQLFNITEPSRFLKGSVSKEIQAEVRAFNDAITVMEMTILGASKQGGLDKKVRDQGNQICGACRYFMQQFEHAMDSFRPGVRLPFAPTNWPLKMDLEQLIQDHRVTGRAGSFPRFKRVAPALAAKGHTLSEKMYGHYKRDYRNGKYGNLVQQKKGTK